jgi:hypothetical protein
LLDVRQVVEDEAAGGQNGEMGQRELEPLHEMSLCPLSVACPPTWTFSRSAAMGREEGERSDKVRAKLRNVGPR